MNFFRAISNLLRFDRTNWKALALCLFAASVFWIFNALNKEYSTNVSFPLRFAFDDEKFVPVDPMPEMLTLNVKGNGWDLLRKSLGYKVQDVLIAIDRPGETKKIPGSALAPIAAGQVTPLHVNFAVTDTLHFQIEPKVARRLALVADLSGVTFRKGLGRTSDVVILPDTGDVEGPRSVIESLPNPAALHVNGNRIAANFRNSIEVDLNQKHVIRRNPPVAEVMFEVGPVEEIALPIKLKVAKAPWGIEFDMDSVRCVFRVSQKDMERFRQDVSAAYVTFDFGELAKGEVRYYLPALFNTPAYADVLHIDSIRVKKY